MSIAVLFGINYPGTTSELRGCANDVSNMANFLKGKYSTILQYTDIDPNTKSFTTKKGILEVFNDLVNKSNKEGVQKIFIHYSGHGSYVRDRNHDEVDGKDEALVPSDYQKSGLIIDDDIRLFLSKFPETTRVTMVMDCCHSGTIADLSYRCVNPDSPITFTGRNPISCKCIMISGCLDNQTSADAYNMENQGKFSGALTTSLLKVLSNRPNIDTTMLHRRLTMRLRRGGFTQRPQICASYDFKRKTENFIE